MNIKDLPKGAYKVVSSLGSTPNAPTTPDPFNDPFGHIQSKIQPKPVVNHFFADPKNLENITKGTTTSVLGNVAKDFSGAVDNTVKNIGSQYMDSAKNMIQNSQDSLAGKKSPVSTTLQNVGEIAKSIFAPISATASSLTKPISEALSNNKTFSKVADSPVGNAVSKAQQAFQQLKEAHPEAAKNFEAAFNIALLYGGEQPVNAVGSKIAEGGTSLVDMAKSGVETVKSSVEDAAKQKAAVAAEQSSKAAEDIAGKVTRGLPEDKAATSKALSNIDLTEVQKAPKNQHYKALENTLNNKIKELSNYKGKALETNTTPYKLSDLATKTGKVSHNFVSDAMDQLESFYEKTNNPKGASEISDLRNTAKTKGLTVKQLDDLATRHSWEFDKNYNANGELASGLSKQAAENTRMGVKNTARDLVGNEGYKMIDKQIGETIKTRDLIKQRVKEVNKLQQQIQERGWGEQAGRLIGKVANVVGLNTPKGLVEYFLSRGTGLKTLNHLELDASLAQDLTNLQKLSKVTNQDEMVTELQKMVKENSNPQGNTSTSTAKAADLKYNGKTKQGLIKVNNYQSQFPKYFTPTQIARGVRILKSLEQAGHTIDMKAINTVAKRIIKMDDIKPPKTTIRYEKVKEPVKVKVKNSGGGSLQPSY